MDGGKRWWLGCRFRGFHRVNCARVAAGARADASPLGHTVVGITVLHASANRVTHFILHSKSRNRICAAVGPPLATPAVREYVPAEEDILRFRRRQVCDSRRPDWFQEVEGRD